MFKTYTSLTGGFALKTIIILSLVLFLPAAVYPASEKGKQLYNDWCAQCHGYDGDGKGYADNFTFPKPRDFTSGTYKFRSTPSGEPPVDGDIIRSTRVGNPGTSMPGWNRFSDTEVQAMVDYIKGFEEETFEFPGEPIEIGKAPAVTDELLERGKELYDQAKCWECHGKLGRGDGEKGWQKNKDDWGNKVFPADLTHAWELRNGSTVEDVYKSISTGFDGTPMASFQDAYSEEDRWALSHFVVSMQTTRKFGSAISVQKVKDIPTSTEGELWDTVDYIDIPIAGQVIFEPRHFSPTITNMRVRGLFTDTEMAIMLEWTDKKPERGSDVLPPDAVRLQFPAEIPSGAEKPYFFLGERKNPVNLWYWSASDNQAVEFNAKGQAEDSMIRQKNSDIESLSSYRDGLYRVLFKRTLKTDDPDDIPFELGTFIPFSIAVFDGQNNEQKNRAVISAWYYIMLEPPTPINVFILPPVVSLAVLGIGISLRRKLLKKSKAS
jgi:DMSO reductase family type II enzyme heme b subunit